MLKNKLVLIAVLCLFTVVGYGQQKPAISLVPATPSTAPDYFCTWNLQGYVANYVSSVATRQEMTEQNIFGTGKYEGWINMFSRLHKDLFFVLDDAWDTPLENGDKDYYGSLIPDTARFPSTRGNVAGAKTIGIITKDKTIRLERVRALDMRTTGASL